MGIGLDQIIGRVISGPVIAPLPPGGLSAPLRRLDLPEELSDFTGVPLITAGLLSRGYSDEAIADIMGLNWLRVWEEVWGG